MNKLKYMSIILCLAISMATVDVTKPVYSAEAIQPDYSVESPLVIGIFPRRNAKVTVKIFKPLAKYLSDQLGREVKLVVTKDFKSFWEGVTNRKYDIVHYNQYHYVVSHKKYGYQVILKNEEFGEPTIAGSIIVRKDSGINSVMDLKGKKIIFGGGPKAMQSYIIASYLLMQGGLKREDYIEAFAKNPPNAIMSAYYKQSAAAGSGDKVLRLGIVKKRIDIKQMKYLVRGEQLPHLLWAAKGDMAPALRDRIQVLLTGLKETPEGRELLGKAKLTGLVKAVDEEFDKHRSIIKVVYNEEY